MENITNMSKYIGTFNYANGYNWIRIWKKVTQDTYKEVSGSTDDKETRERYKEKYNIKEFVDLKLCNFKYII